ncbi:MAG: cell division ATP-binding protein FtsE [Clostridiales bacterium]|nr:cell division ATP-binding protein FtsE [Clostridiales bacterium]
MISFKKVFMRYPNGVTALNGLDLEIEEGEFVFVVGPSGAGKSTFIKLLLKELEPTKGKILLDGENITKVHTRRVPKIRKKIGVVFQDFRLLPNKTAYENIAFALEITRTKSKDVKPLVKKIMDLVGLKDKEKSKPNELSGGEQQRVSIARAIVNDPPILICDEPTGNLDPDTSWEIMKLLRNINKAGTTIIMVTHDKTIVNDMKQRVVAIENGRIVRDEISGVYGYDD